jgi:kinesin family protein 11
MFEDMVAHVNSQKAEINQLRLQLQEANQQVVEANRRASAHLAQTMEEENAHAEAERDHLMSQIRSLIEESRQRQFGRLKGRVECVRTDIMSSGDSLEQATAHYDRQVDEWVFKSEQFAKDVIASRDEFKTKMQHDWEVRNHRLIRDVSILISQTFDQRNASIQKVTESVHEETVRIVDAQMKDMSRQMGALDDFVAKARAQNGQYCDAHMTSLQSMASNAQQSYAAYEEHLAGSRDRTTCLQEDANQQMESLRELTLPLSDEVQKPLSELRTNIRERPLQEYIPTGITPQKRRYEYPTTLPRTEAHDALVKRMRTSKELDALPFSNAEPSASASSLDSSTGTPLKGFVYHDVEDEVGAQQPPSTAATPSNTGLREVDANIVAKQLACDTDDDSTATQSKSSISANGRVSLSTDKSAEIEEADAPPAKRHCSSSGVTDNKLPQKMLTKKMAGMMEGRENVPLPGSRGRRLRSQQPSD